MAPSSSALSQQKYVSQITLTEKLAIAPKLFSFSMSPAAIFDASSNHCQSFARSPLFSLRQSVPQPKLLQH